MKPFILACPPVDVAKQRELGIVGFSPAPEATQGACARCHTAVWLGRKVRAAKAQSPEAAVLCFGCAFAEGRSALSHLGGNGGRYLVNPALIKKPV